MSDRIQRFLLWVLALGLIGGTIIALRYATGYRYVAGYGLAPPSLPPNVALRLSGIQVVGRENGVPAWTVTADQIDTTRNRDRVEFSRNIRAELLQNGKSRATVTAASATFSEPLKQLTASGNIVCLIHGEKPTPSGDLKIETDQVSWNIGSRQIGCAGKVRATMKGIDLQGVRFNVDMNTRAFDLQDWRGEFDLGGDQSPADTLNNVKELVKQP